MVVSRLVHVFVVVLGIGLSQALSQPPTLPEIIVEAQPSPDVPPAESDTASSQTESAPLIPAEEPAIFPPSSNRSAPNVSPIAQNAGRAADLIGETTAASQGLFGAADLAQRPLSRPGEALELTPGLIVTQHSGSGKANQFFVRGFNLDHGTDFAVRLNDVPLNLPTHAHGQGYLDINWLIPELIDQVEYKLGPYYADLGDFSSAGGLDIDYRLTMPHGLASVTAGQFDYYRTLVADSIAVKDGNVLYAFETTFYDGPWEIAEDFEKLNAVVRRSWGDRRSGHALTAMAYHADWVATNQIPQAAVGAGIVNRFGSLDPSDGGETSRYSLNSQWWQHDRDSTTQANLYLNYYDLDLYSNFTFFLDDQVNGDQIQQTERRLYGGMNLSHEIRREFMTHTVGAQLRADDIPRLQLNHTSNRQLVNPVRDDQVDQQSYALYYTNEAILLDWMRSITSLRGDVFQFHTRSLSNPADSGTTTDTILSPKAGLVFGPWADSELFLNWGQSFHSNDARGVNASIDPANPLVKSEGSEIGARSWLTEDWNATLTLWQLQLDSELVFVGDAGTTEAGPASTRHGVTLTNHWHLSRVLSVDADYSFVRPRFDSGERIPNAVENVLGSGFMLRGPSSPFYLSGRLRHYGPAALIEDNSARGNTTTVFNLQAGYERRGWFGAVDIFNVFDRRDNDITYFYTSQSTPAGLPMDDYHFHPVEPAMFRVTLGCRY